jgi:hypothetical protein
MNGRVVSMVVTVSKQLVLIFNSILLHMLWETIDAMDAMDAMDGNG